MIRFSLKMVKPVILKLFEKQFLLMVFSNMFPIINNWINWNLEHRALRLDFNQAMVTSTFFNEEILCLFVPP